MIGDEPFFSAKRIDYKEVDDFAGVLLTVSRLEASKRYKNTSDKEIDYQLVIQLSTRRYVERFSMVLGNKLLTETQGRCASVVKVKGSM